MKKKVTLEQLAANANVSIATVSRVLAGRTTVDPAIRVQVRKAAERVGVNLEERRKARSRIVAFLLANRDVLHNFQARVLLGAEGYCTECNWELLFLSFRYTPEVPADALHLPQLLSQRTNAQAVILGGNNSPNLFEALNSRGIPFAVLGNNVVGRWTPKDCDVVYSDDINGAFSATEYLLAQGHRAIGFVGNLRLPWYARCYDGYARSMKLAGLPAICEDIHSDGSQLGYLATKSLMARPVPPTALFAGSDPIATGIYSALRELGLSIPADVSVMGFNDTLGSLTAPPLTTMREFPEEIGRHMAEFALSRLQKPGLPPRELTIPTQLIARESVAAPPLADTLPLPRLRASSA